MKLFFILAAALLSTSVASAEFLHMRGPNFSITLTENACPAEVAANIKPEFRDKFKEVWMVLHGRTALACWIRHTEEPGVAVIIDANGQALGVELSRFEVDKGV